MQEAQAERAIRALRGLGRSIITAVKAEELAEGFGVTLNDLGIRPSSRKAGVDFDNRSEVWAEGEGVDAYALTMALADHFECPHNDYPTDYIGTGKRVEALHVQAMLRLREGLLGEPPPKCQDCGSLDCNPTDDTWRCWSCQRDLIASGDA